MKQPHICLDETLGVRYAILPGDPARLDRIAQQLEGVRELAYNREFRSLTGTYRGVPILAVSTGIGGSSAGICVEELHNIGVEAAIRIGCILPRGVKPSAECEAFIALLTAAVGDAAAHTRHIQSSLGV